MIEILSTRPKTIKELSQILELSPRQVNRNLLRLEDRGYCVDKNSKNRYFIFGVENIQNKVFNEEEQELISKMLAINAAFHPLYASIKLKLKSATTDIPLASQNKSILKSKNYQIIHYAIQNQLRIKLKNYVSPFNPDMPEERLLEPLEFVEEHCQLIAYEVSTRKEKVFKLDRMGIVELTNEVGTGKTLKNTLIDPFGFSSTKQKIVKLKLSLLAKVLLMEDFATATPYLIQKNDVWYYHGPYCNFLGISRFIMGLPGEVTIIYGPELKAYLIEQKKEFTF